MIISASKRTDIPAFYSEWFIRNLKNGVFRVRNPLFPRKISEYRFEKQDIDCIVFWTKYPKPLMKHIDYLLQNYNFYFQFTLNDYPNTIEPNLPMLDDRIQTFKDLSLKIGKKRIIWRYDPIIITYSTDVDYHIHHFKKIFNEIKDYTNRIVISFVDEYARNQKRLKNIKNEITSDSQAEFIIKEFKNIAKSSNIEIFGCAEDKYISFGLNGGKCIDDELINKLFNIKLKTTNSKEREGCHCIKNIDIGAYNTCPYNCVYCYANNGNLDIKIVSNFEDEDNLMIGKITDNDQITVTHLKSSKLRIRQEFMDIE